MSFRTIEGGGETRHGVATLPHDRSALLWSADYPTPLFLDSIDRWVDAMVADEHGGGDAPEGLVKARISAKDSGILCGRPVAERLLARHLSECSAEWGVSEGGAVEKGQTVLVLHGPADGMLRFERILLNLLGRLSGISSNTAHWAESAGSMRVAATRKTEWGLLDKWAIHIGGGLTHRLDRGDALMLKENDLAAMMGEGETGLGAMSRMVSSVDMEQHAGFTVVEVRSVEQAVTAATAWVTSQSGRGGDEKVVLLLDNMGPEVSSDVGRALSENGLRDHCVLEGSGGVSLDSLGDWAASGVDLVSSSALNRGVTPLDLSMLIVAGGE